MRRLLVFLAFLWTAAAPALADAPAETPEQQALVRYFQAPILEEAWFAPNLLKAAPLTQLQAVRDQLVAAYGPLAAVKLGKDGFSVELERAFLPAKAALDADGRFVALWFGPPVARGGSLEQVATEIAALPGGASLLVTRDGTVLAERDADQRLAVGSAFKLAVLLALQQEIEAGRAAWDEVMRLEDRFRSLPSGLLQDWPAAAPLTLHSLASLMISLSDNTATDALIYRVGPSRVEALLPPEARPLLTTRQYFLLGGQALAGLRAAWMNAGEETRRALLAGLGSRTPSLADFTAGAATADFGWQLSTRELCGLMDQVVGLPVLAIETAGADPAEWQAVGFKGGSVAGAMSLVGGFVDGAGRRLCLAITWNDPALDAVRLQQLYAQALALLPRE